MQGTSITEAPVVYEVEYILSNKLSTTVFQPIIQAALALKQTPKFYSLEKTRKSVHHKSWFTLSHIHDCHDTLDTLMALTQETTETHSGF